MLAIVGVDPFIIWLVVFSSHQKMQVLRTTSISFLNERWISSDPSCLPKFPLLSGLINQERKWFLPAIHLDHFDPVDNLVHQADSLVSLASSLHSEPPELFAHPGCKKSQESWRRQKYPILCGGTAAISRAAPTRALGPIF